MKKYKLYFIPLKDLKPEIESQCDNLKIVNDIAFVYTNKKIDGLIHVNDPMMKELNLTNCFSGWLETCQIASIGKQTENKKSKDLVKSLENDFKSELEKALEDKPCENKQFPNLGKNNFTYD